MLERVGELPTGTMKGAVTSEGEPLSLRDNDSATTKE